MEKIELERIREQGKREVEIRMQQQRMERGRVLALAHALRDADAVIGQASVMDCTCKTKWSKSVEAAMDDTRILNHFSK